MKTLLTLMLTMLSFFSMAQIPQSPGGGSRSSVPVASLEGNGKISGTVIDAESNTPVEFATIALHNAATDKVVNGTVADGKGKFTITKVEDGTYNVVISFIGYETQTISNLKVEGKNNDLNVGTIKLSTGSKVLNEVVVEGKKDLIEERVDRTIYNAENDATARGGDATDVLKRVPLLSVDLDGNVSLRGSNNILVLINNKPSTIMASSVADALKQIPADQIKTVEVITSPSAKYDAEGSGGIINIITKKNTLEGLTLNVDAGVGYRGSNLGLNGAYRKKKMGFSLGGFGRANYNINGDFQNDQTITSATQERSTSQRGDNESSGLFGNYNLGWDYDINKKNALAASVRFGVRNNNSIQDNLRTLTLINGIENASNITNNETISESANVDANFTYTHYFEKPQQELSILSSFSRNDRTNDFFSTSFDQDFAILSRFRNDNDGVNEEYTFQADYQTPIGTNQIFETGIKQIIRKVTSDVATASAAGATDEFVVDPTKSSLLTYNQNVSSAYGAYTYSTKNGYSLKGGLRYEYTTIEAFTPTESNIEIPEYGVLVPSINASKKLKSGKTIKASYNRRIQRPSIQFLNPVGQNSSNQLNVTIGNPQLDPEFTDNYEVGYSTFIKGVTLNLTGFFRNSDNAIQSLREAEGDVIITQYANIGKEQAYGSSLFANVSLGKLTLSGGGDLYYSVLDNNVPNPDERASNEGWVPSGRLFGGYTLEKGWGLQFFGFYRGRRVQLQGVQGGFGIYSLAIRKDFANKRGSFGAGIENFLAKSITIRNETITNSPSNRIVQKGFTTQNNFGFRFNISYRIGKMSFDNQPRRRRSVNNDDLKDGGDGGSDMGNMGGGQQGGNTGGGQRGGGMPAGVRPATPATANANTPAADPAARVNAEGKWTYTLETPQGASNGTLTIVKDGDTYKGTIVSTRNPKETALTSVILKGNELTVTYDVSFGGNTASIQMKGIINGNEMAGNITMGQFGSFPMKAKRGE